MKYYSVAEITIIEPDWVPEYVARVTRLVERSGGRYLARTPRFDKTEGERPTGQILLIIEWPSKEAAHVFYDSDEYRPHRERRMAGALTEAVLIAGEDINRLATIDP